MIPAQDPTYTATRWIRKAKEAKKPLRVFLGVNNRGGERRLLVCTNDATDLARQAPREELTVHPDASPEILAVALEAIWNRLQAITPKTYQRSQHQRFNPGRVA